MKLHGKIIISAIALTFSGHFSNLTARGPIDQHLIDEAMPMVDKAPDGFFCGGAVYQQPDRDECARD